MRGTGTKPKKLRAAAKPCGLASVAAQREAAAKYRAIFEHAREGILQTTVSGDVVTANPALVRLLGFDSAYEFMRAAPNMRNFYADSAKRSEIVRLLKTHGAAINQQLQWRRRDGNLIWVSVDIQVVEDELGAAHYEGTVRDITELKRAEEALKKSEEHYRSLFDNMLNGCAYCRVIFEQERAVDLTYLSVNRAFETLTGLKDVVGKNISTVIPNFRTSDSDLLEIFGRVARAGVPERFERYVNALGMWFFISIYSPEKDHIAVVFDVITERKRAEAALRESEERHRMLFEYNPFPLWVYDVETLRFVAVNESALHQYGYTREEFLAMSITDLHLKEDVPAVKKMIVDEPIKPKRTAEWRHRRKDGTIIRVEIVSSKLAFSGRSTRLVLASDVTEKKLLEEKFLHSQRLESIGMLAAGIAHDINNVLAPIMLAAPMLRANASSAHDVKILDTLEQNASRGAALVKQILGFAHTSSGEFRPTQVKHLLRDIIDVIEETFPKSILFEHEVSNGLWMVLGNPVQIHQVLLNLCVNARDALPDGGTLRIAASNRRLDAEEARALPGAHAGPWLVIEISDNGIGIPADILAHIWDPFFTTKGVGKGTGLGLSTVRGIVASHRGFVTVDTAPGRGSAFRVFLPATDDEAVADQVAVTAGVAPPGKGELVLVVDDDDAVRETVTAILTKYNYRVLAAADGVEAISLLTTHHAELSLIVTDVDIPYLGGGALAHIATQLCPDLRLMVMSGLSGGDSEDSPLEAAKKMTHACLLKPFAPEALLETVYNLLHPPETPARANATQNAEV